MTDFTLGFVLWACSQAAGAVALFLLVADWVCGLFIRRRANPPQQPQVDARRGFYNSTGEVR
jgi:hypothetical protein